MIDNKEWKGLLKKKVEMHAVKTHDLRTSIFPI